MKKWMALCLCLLTLSLPAEARKRKKADKQPAAAQKETTRQGLFTVVKSGDDWYFEVSDSLLGRRILATVRYTATPAATSMYGGELANQQTVYWEEAPGDRLLLRADMTVNVANPSEAINRAVIISNENPIIGLFKTEGRTEGRRKIKVTQLFSDDNSALGLPRPVKDRLGLTSQLAASSYIESIKTFPINTEVRSVKTYASTSPKTVAGRATGRVTVGLNVSFVLLPEKPMGRRLFDPRVGYFADQFYYYSDHQQQVEDKRFIVRWRLEPKDSADAERMKRGELVEPKKPIVYYIDPATPPQWRKYLIAGVNDWQKAFERAGFKNAIMAKEWPENDSTMSMEDARFSVIRYLASPIPNAYGPQVHDPRSGEIIESHICWYHNVMTLVHDWYMIQAGTLDEAARKMHYDEELMGQLIRFVSSHEVGHTLGLRHNFGASSTVPVDSLRSKSWVEKHGHTPSIMDYARFNYVAQPEDSISRKGIFPRIGDYDLWAIEWGYTPMFDAYDDESDRYELEKLIGDRLRREPRLWFGDGETNVTNDPRCQTEDLGDDAVKASELGLLNLQREMAALPRWTFDANDPEGKNLRRMYGQIETQFLRYANHVLANIGGIYADYKTSSEPGPIYTDTPRQRQEAALAYLDRNVMNEPAWLINTEFAKRLFPDPSARTSRIGCSLVARMLSASKLQELTQTYPAADYLDDLLGRLFKETATGHPVSLYRRGLQAQAVTTLIDVAGALSTASTLRAPVLDALRTLGKKLDAARPADRDSRAHYFALRRTINRAFEEMK